MKQYIPFIGCLTGLFLLAVSPLQAQSDARTRSRLEIGRSTANAKPALTGTLPSRSLSLLNPSASSLDRNVNKNSTVNTYYRSLLMAPTKSATRIETAEPAANQVTDNRPATDESARAEKADARLIANKTENRMFVNDRITVSNIYPNPAVGDFADVDYQFLAPIGEAKLVLVNIVGAPVAEYSLEPQERKIRISTHNMTNGLYFYQLSLDGRTVATKKLLVRHQ